MHRPLRGAQIVQELNLMFLNDHPSTWLSTFSSFSLPHYTATIACVVVSALHLTFGAGMAGYLAPLIIDPYPVDEETKQFALNQYSPAVSEP